jgi:uncharacterized membrane protein YkoI
MKKAFCLSPIFATAVLFTNAQKIDISKVPAAVKTTFEKKYPGTVAKWELEDGKYEASFKQAKNEMSATFETNGTLAESEQEIKASDLPATVSTYMKKHYKKSIKEAAKITLPNGAVNYEAHVGGMDVIFDAKGNFIKEIKD